LEYNSFYYFYWEKICRKIIKEF